MDDDTYGFIDEAMLRPPQLFGCERTPFLAVIFFATFVTVVGFGITLSGIVGGVMLAAAGIMLLRRIAVYDPFYFAIMFEAARYPRHMPDVLPDRTLPRDLAFGLVPALCTLAVMAAAMAYIIVRFMPRS